MNSELEEVQLLRGVVTDALRARAVRDEPADGDPLGDWQLVRQAGWDTAGLGAEASVREILAVIEELAAGGASVPLIPNHLARWLLAQIDAAETPADELVLMAPPGPRSGLTLSRSHGGHRLHGEAGRVPWARHADRFVLYVRDENRDALVTVACDAEGVVVNDGANLAGEPRDRVVFDDCVVAPQDLLRLAPDRTTVQLRAGLLTAAALCGAMRRAHELAVEHAATREQFGRPIARFDAVAAHLATMAAEIEVVRSVIDRAADAHDIGIDRLLHTAAAKVAAADAAGMVAERSHQVLGALGTTREHPLHRYTAALLSWRDEWGAEHEWARALGEYGADLGTDEFWAVLTL